MKINLHEDEIDGDVQDGSINLEEEFQKLIKRMTKDFETNYCDGIRNSLPKSIVGPGIHRGRVEFSNDYSSNGDKELRWFIVGYFKEDNENKINFVIPRDIIAKSFLYIVDFIKQHYPEVMSYPTEILTAYTIRLSDVDFYTNGGLIPGGYFYRHNDEFKSNTIKKAYMFKDVFEHTETVANMFVLPHDFNFHPNFQTKYYRAKQKGKTFAKAYQKGTFEGHDYEFKRYNLHISPSYHAFDTENLTLKDEFWVSINYHALHIDGVDYSDEIYNSLRLGKDDELPFSRHYLNDLIAALKPIFDSHGLNVD